MEGQDTSANGISNTDIYNDVVNGRFELNTRI